MSDHSPIIDVDPVASTSDAARGARPSEGDAFRAPSYGKGAAQAAVNATIIDGGTGAKRKPSRIGGAVQTAVGGALMLVLSLIHIWMGDWSVPIRRSSISWEMNSRPQPYFLELL